MEQGDDRRVVIIGAGPAGLTAAYELGKAGIPAVVIERERQVGGLAKTINHEGFRFDIGGHRFYTKVAAADRVWREVLPAADFLRRKRLSRIYYAKKFFDYPLRAPSVVFRLGLWQGSLILASYLRARLRPDRSELTFEQWVTNRFGRRLYSVFFKPYTEKVWGIPCSEITADWAAQRIRGLSLTSLLKDLLLGQPRGRGKGAVVKSLVDEFDYPRLGPGMMWEAMAELVRGQGGRVSSGASVEKIYWTPDGIDSIEVAIADGHKTVRGTHFISSMPLRELVAKLEPAPPAEVAAAAERLQYRDFLTVALVVNRRDLFPDNWIYIHDPGVKLGRVQNFKNWSADMVPDPDKTCLGLEYFCFKGDELWSMPDEELIELGKRELAQLGLAAAEEIAGGTVVRVPRAYPVYDSTYKQSLATLRRYFDALPNIQLVGRNGMHRYNNQDHSMLTAMLAVKNIQGASHDLWEVNAEGEYHEEIKVGVEGATGAGFSPIRHGRGQPSVPERINVTAGVRPSVEYET